MTELFPATIAGSLPKPAEIKRHLDQFVIGQDDAKRAVAVALRNRWRRQQLPSDLRDEVMPKNIIMIGPTGVGKTEIARRLAKLAGAPFVKVEASKFTEVGYVGRDVEGMVRDLVENAIAAVSGMTEGPRRIDDAIGVLVEHLEKIAFARQRRAGALAWKRPP